MLKPWTAFLLGLLSMAIGCGGGPEAQHVDLLSIEGQDGVLYSLYKAEDGEVALLSVGQSDQALAGISPSELDELLGTRTPFRLQASVRNFAGQVSSSGSFSGRTGGAFSFVGSGPDGATSFQGAGSASEPVVGASCSVESVCASFSQGFFGGASECLEELPSSVSVPARLEPIYCAAVEYLGCIGASLELERGVGPVPCSDELRTLEELGYAIPDGPGFDAPGAAPLPAFNTFP